MLSLSEWICVMTITVSLRLCSQEPKIVQPLHFSCTDVDRAVCLCPPLRKVTKRFFVSVDAEQQMVVGASLCTTVDVLLIWTLMSFGIWLRRRQHILQRRFLHILDCNARCSVWTGVLGGGSRASGGGVTANQNSLGSVCQESQCWVFSCGD